jgi:HK97 family phage prohead protease
VTQSTPEISPITSVAESRDALFVAPEVIQRDVGEAIEREETADNQHWFRLVTPDVDRHGTIIRPEGVKTERFAKNPVFLWLHQTGGGGGTAPSPEVVIGSVVKWEQDETRFDILVEFDTSPLASECLRKVKAKLLRMVSLGFRPIPGKTSKREIAGKMHPVYDEVELMEASLVIVGSNPEALALSRAIEGAGVRGVSERSASAV